MADSPQSDAPEEPEGSPGSTTAAEPAASESAPAPNPLHDLGAYIRSQRNGAQLSLRNLAKLAGVSNPYLSQIERGLRKPSAEILQAIAKALEISSETLYIRAGILEERDGEPDLEVAIARDRHLTEPQRQTLTEMYRSFRQLNDMQDGEEPRRRGPAERLRGLIEQVTPGDDSREAEAAGPEDPSSE